MNQETTLLAGLAAAGLLVVAGAAWMVGEGGLAAALLAGALLAGGLALVRLRRERTRRELERLFGASARVLLGVLVGVALGDAMRASGLQLSLSALEEDALEGVFEWAREVEGPVEAVILGPEGHRVTRAAQAVLERVARAHGAMRVRRLDPAADGAARLVGRQASPGEVLLTGGGRAVVARDASPRALAAALRGLADPGHREIRFLASKVAPGAPAPHRRAAAAMAAEVGAAVTQGPPVERARVWVLDPEHHGPVEVERLTDHLGRGGGLLCLLDRPPGEALAAWLGARGIEVGAAWLLDDEEGPGRGRGTLRVRAPGGAGRPAGGLPGPGREPGLLPGARAVSVRAPAAALLVPVASRKLDLGEHPAAGGPRRARGPFAVAAAALATGSGWLAVVGDHDLLSDAALGEGGNRELAVELASYAMDRRRGLPPRVLPPRGGVDPDLHPVRFRVALWILLVALPMLPLLVAAALHLGRPRPGPAGP